MAENETQQQTNVEELPEHVAGLLARARAAQNNEENDTSDDGGWWSHFTPSATKTAHTHGKPVLTVRWDFADVPVIYDGCAYPPRMQVEAYETETTPPLEYRVVIGLDGTAAVERLQIFPRSGVFGVRGVELERLSTDRLIQQALDLVVRVGRSAAELDSSGQSAAFIGAGHEMTRRQRRSHDGRLPTHGRPTLTDEHYQRVAALYREHGSVRAVADAMGSSYSTTARWVAAARARGLLEERSNG